MIIKLSILSAILSSRLLAAGASVGRSCSSLLLLHLRIVVSSHLAWILEGIGSWPSNSVRSIRLVATAVAKETSLKAFKIHRVDHTIPAPTLNPHLQ